MMQWVLTLRLTVSILMLIHGVAKKANQEFLISNLSSIGIPSEIAYGVYVGEV